MAIQSQTIRAGALVLALLLTACGPATDRDRYQVGESGVATFQNQLSATLYLGGCGHFDYEKRIGNNWVSQGPDAVCVWEGYASPVAPGGLVTDSIRAREPGTWRLRYRVGAGCSEAAPLGDDHCEVIAEIASNAFEVAETECVVGGCSDQFCAEEPIASSCEWLPYYACFRAARCGHFGPAGSCGWQPTPELGTCLDALRGIDPVATSR